MRAVLKTLKWGFVAAVALVLAWLVVNNPLADAAARPRPAELMQAPASALPAAGNAFFALQALTDGAAPAVAPWSCPVDKAACDETAWLDQAPLLREHVRAREAFVQRCEAIVSDPAFAFEEPVPALQPGNVAATAPPVFKPISQCLRWFRARASVALADGDLAGLQAALGLGDRLTRALLDHSRSLIGHAIGWSVARRQWQFVAALAARRPDLAPTLQRTLLRPLSAEALSSQRWIASESAFQTALTTELAQGCAVPAPATRSRLDRVWCPTGLGLLPQRTQQLFDQHWLEVLAASRQGPAAGMKRVVLQATEAPSWILPAWRNTVGQALFDVARPAYGDYLARQFDVELARQATVLALGLDSVPPAGRAAWLAAEPIDPLLKERLSLDGDRLVARSWVTELKEHAEPRDQIRVPLAH